MTSTVSTRLAALSLAAALAPGCGLFGGRSSGGPGPAEPDVSTTRTEAYAAAAADRCEASVRDAEDKLDKALALARGEGQGPGGGSLEPAGVLLKKIRDLDIAIDLSPAEAPDGTVAQSILILRDSLGDEANHFMEHPPTTAREKKKLERYTRKATKGVGVINAFRHQVIEVGITFLDTNFAAQSCHTSAVQMAAFVERMQRYGTGATRPNVALEREALARLVAAGQRSDALASATMGLVATFQATVSDGKDAAIVDAAVTDVSEALAEPSDAPTDGIEEADALLAAAKVQLDEVEADPAAKAQLQGGPASASAPTATPTLVVRPDRVEKGKAIVTAATAAASGNWGGAVASAAALLPEGSSLHHAMAGAGAIMSGDYLGAVEAATKLARSRPRLANAMDRLRDRLKGA
jgi:hypothetical protein